MDNWGNHHFRSDKKYFYKEWKKTCDKNNPLGSLDLFERYTEYKKVLRRAISNAKKTLKNNFILFFLQQLHQLNYSNIDTFININKQNQK